MYDIIIIGAGPAGLTAAIYALRANKKILLLEANKVGGNILKAHKVDNYPGLPHVTGQELADTFFKQVEELGAEIKYEKAMNIMENGKTYFVQTVDNMYEAKSVIVATGNDRSELKVPGEKEFLGKGVSYCATCDGNFFKNKKVAVIGGGEESIEDALYLSNLCEKVYFVYNRKMDLSKLNKDNIEIIESSVKSINGEVKVESITLEDQTIEVSGVFVSIANVPETKYILKNFELDEQGNVLAEEDVKTNKKKLYVAGDVRQKRLRQVATAVSDGALAATIAIRELED